MAVFCDELSYLLSGFQLRPLMQIEWRAGPSCCVPFVETLSLANRNVGLFYA